MVNSVVLMGRLGSDVDVRKNQKGESWGRVSLAVDRGKNKDGQSYGTDWINLVLNGASADNAARFLGKGRQVVVEGSLRVDVKQNADGTKTTYTSVRVSRWHFADSKPQEQGNGAVPQAPAPSAAPQAAPAQPTAPAPQSPTDDDIPF